MSKKNETSEYVEPQVERLAGDVPAVEVIETAAVQVVDKAKLPGTVIPDHIGIGRLLNAQSTAVTDILIERVARHLEYTIGDKGFADKQARADEQGGFINTVLGSLELAFEKFVVFTDYLLTQLRENAGAINTGKLLRHMSGLAETYDKDKIKKYTTYLSFLTRIALNWKIRYKLNTLIDVNLFVSSFSPKARENITTYFNHLQNV